MTYGYDSGRRRSSLSVLQPNASPWAQSYTNDAMRRLSSVTSPAGTFSYAYTAAGSLVNLLTLPAAAEIVNTYDSLGRQTQTVLRDGATWMRISTNYFIYDQAGRRMTNARDHGVWTRYTYDDIGQLKTAWAYQTNSSQRTQEKFGFSYDAAGNLQYRTNSAMIQTFTMNGLNQLTNVTRTGNLTIVGTHSPSATNVTVSHNGNTASNMFFWPDYTFVRSGYQLPDGTNTFVAVAKDALGRVDTNSSVVFTPTSANYFYDANGNLTYDGIKSLEYDDENQLIRVTATNAWKSEFVYDGKMRRRVRREYTWFPAPGF